MRVSRGSTRLSGSRLAFTLYTDSLYTWKISENFIDLYYFLILIYFISIGHSRLGHMRMSWGYASPGWPLLWILIVSIPAIFKNILFSHLTGYNVSIKRNGERARHATKILLPGLQVGNPILGHNILGNFCPILGHFSHISDLW